VVVSSRGNGGQLYWTIKCNEVRRQTDIPVPDSKRRSEQDIAGEILAYFLRNPDAADSLTGIARWRLLEERVRLSVEVTDAALKLLIEQGYLRRVPVEGAESIFVLNKDRRGDAELFLDRERPPQQ
jgi:hypothetical protein